MARKIILFSLALLPLGLASYALAAEGFVALAPIPGLTDGGVADSSRLPAFFNNLYKYLIGLAAVLAIIEIIWGGLEISTQDSVSKQSSGRERITQAIFGLILVLSPALVFGIINPRILDLQLGLTPINLDFTPYTPTVRDASVPYTTGSGNPCGGINTGANCTTTVFDEGYYSSPPLTSFCYQMKTPYQGKSYNCFRNSANCTATRRTSCGTPSEDASCPADTSSLNSCTQY